MSIYPGGTVRNVIRHCISNFINFINCNFKLKLGV